MGAPILRDTGVVLRTIKLGEADRIVTLLTLNHGKIKAVAKGARKSGSKYSARLEVGSIVDFQWIDSRRDLVRLTQVETVRANRKLREDLDLLNATARMLDAVDMLCEHSSSPEEISLMTIRALTTMDQTQSKNVCGAFLMKILSIEGFTPETHQCPSCSKEETLTHFSISRAAFYCEDCSNNSMIHTLGLSRESIMAIFDGRLISVIENMDKDVSHEVESIAVALIEHHMGHNLRAVTV